MYTVKLSEHDVKIVMAALGECPHKHVAHTAQTLTVQLAEQNFFQQEAQQEKGEK